jgi:long-chain fatty acid transport protein
MKQTNRSNRSKSATRIAVLGLTALAATSTHATDGYFDYGYGVQAKGIGGAGVAFPQDALAPASNPAGAAFLDNRFDAGLTYFRPDRYASLGTTEYNGNGNQNFYVPEIGYKNSLSTNLVFDLAVYGNGGMNTDYTTPVPGFGTTSAGVDLDQVFIAPAFAYKLNDNHAIGIDPIFAVQRIKVHGLENFGVFGSSGYDYSYGGGVRIGYTGKWTDWLTVGATYQSRIFTTPFNDYKNLFAEQGSFDIPSNFAVGIAVKPQKQVTFALDVEHIFFSEVKAVGNGLSAATFASGLGSNNGPGFGWRDVTAVKTGIAYDATENLTLRVGYNYSTQPIPDNQTYFNVLAPAVVQHHVTAGLTWRFNKNWEASAFYAHAFEQHVNGSGNFFGPPTNANLKMSQDSVGIAIGWIL